MLKKVYVLVLVMSMLFFLAGCDQLYFKDYEASGVVKDGSGAGVESASVNFSDGSSVKTMADGSWEQTGLKGDIEITPKKSGYTFTPSSFNLSHLDDNRANIIFNANPNGTNSDDSDNPGGEDGSDENEGNSFVLSGIIENEAEQGVSDVIIQFNSGEFSSVTTAEDGSWEKEGLTGRIEVKPEKYGYTFEPPTRSFETTDENVNFTAIAEEQPYKVRGSVTNEENIPIPDVVINFSDGTSVNTDYKGDWEKTGLTGEVVVTPELDDWQFSPANRTVYEENDTTYFIAQPSDNFKYYTLSGDIQNSNGEYIYIEIEREDGTLIADAVTDDEGNWTANNVWGTVEIIPRTTNTINSFEPASKIRSRADENVDFIAE